MSDVQLMVSVPKELHDALQALEDLVVALKAGTPLPDLISKELAAAMKLFPELSQIMPEVKSETGEAVDATLLHVRKIAWVLLGKQQ